MTVKGTHYLEVNSVPLYTYGWQITDLSALYDMPAIRGQDRLIPGESGRKAYKRRADVTRYVFPLQVFGAVDEDNVAYADEHEGLLTNIAYLRDNVATPGDTGDGLVTAIWHRPGALDDLTADCHVTAFSSVTRGERAMPHIAWFDLEISVPSGTWTAVP